MEISFHKNALEDYKFFKKNNKKISDKIDSLISNIIKTPFIGIGKPEPLKHHLSGFWSRRISNEHRLVYAIRDNNIYILQCRYHYC